MSGVYVTGQDDKQEGGDASSDAPVVFVPGQAVSSEEHKDTTGRSGGQAQDPSESEEEDSGEDSEEGEGDGDYVADRARPSHKPYKRPNRKKPNKKEMQWKAEFNMFDLDSNGNIEIHDLSKCCMGYVPESVLKKAIAALDTNRDGKISYNEYKTVRKMMGSIKLPTMKKDDADKK